MEHNSRTKNNPDDTRWCYGELRYESHHESKRGLIRRKAALSIRWYKRKLARDRRRREKLELKRQHGYYEEDPSKTKAPQL